jgi:hypothetical protein
VVSELFCSKKQDGDTSKLEADMTRHAIPPTSVTPAPFESVRRDRCVSSALEAFLTPGAVRYKQTKINKSAGAQPVNKNPTDSPSTPKLHHQFIQFAYPGNKYASVNLIRDEGLLCRARVGGALAAAVVVFGWWVLQDKIKASTSA